MRDIKGGLYLSVVMLWAGGLYGARPFTTDDAGTVAQGIHELEFGVDFLSEEVTPGLSFKHGLTERMDLGVGVGYTLAPEENVGFGNAELGLKFAVVPDLFAFSVVGSFGHEEYILNGIITRNLGPVEIDANFGYETDSAVDEDDTVIYALAAIFNAGPHAFGVEGAGDKDGLYSWLVGGRYTLFEGIAIDAGITGGFEEDALITATAGLHCEF